MDITGYLIINIICHFKTPTHLSSKSSLLFQSNKAISKRLKAARRAVKRRNSQKNQCQEKNTQLPLEGVILSGAKSSTAAPNTGKGTVAYI